MMPKDRGGRAGQPGSQKLECCNVPATLGPWVCVHSSHWPCGQVGPQVTDTHSKGRYPWALTCSPGCLASHA